MWLAGIDEAVAPLAPVVSDYADRVTMVYAAEESYPIQLNGGIRSIPQKVSHELFSHGGIRLCPTYRFG
jgi:hypothetical protein